LAIGVLMITPLVRKFGKRKVIIVPLIGTLVIYISMLLFPVDNSTTWIILMAIANMFTFGFQLLSWAMISDAIDYNEWKQGFRSDGSLYSSYIFCRKIGTAISSASVPLLIAYAAPSLELNNAATWTASNVNAIYNMSITFPLVGFGLVFIAYLLVFNITTEDYHAMQKDLGHTIDNG
ncbi:MAG: MFS transporter, partial [Aerococcus viridans]